MKSVLLYAILLVVACAYDFGDYMLQFNRSYGSPEQYHLRKEIFESNYTRILNINSQNLGYQLAPNNLTDRTLAEVKGLLSFIPNSNKNVSSSVGFGNNGGKLRSSNYINWNESGIVSGIKNQGSCGSCWAFTTTALFESFIAQTSNALNDLSEEYVLECTSDSDCTGGYLVSALQLIKATGIPYEEDYPYKAVNSGSTTPSTSGICGTKNTVSKDFTIYQAFSSSVSQIKSALEISPLAVAISAEDIEFNSYSSGVLACPTRKSSYDLNHAVLLVGYDQSNSWIIKNSWGTNWGVNGFGYVSQNTNSDCGLTLELYRIFGLRMASLVILFAFMIFIA